jgi:hypothetical protein
LFRGVSVAVSFSREISEPQGQGRYRTGDWTC